MAKLLDVIEEGILSGNWDIVCSAYNKLTGKNIRAPQKIEAPQFNLDRATKKQIIEELKKLNLYEDRLSKLKIDDLRDYYNLITQEEDSHSTTTESVPQDTKLVNISPNPEYTYIPASAENKILNGDKMPLRVVLSDFESYNDEKSPTQKAKRPTNVVSAKCIKCGSVGKTSLARVIAGVGSPNEKAYICPKCS